MIKKISPYGKIIAIVVGIVILVGGYILGYYYYHKYSELNTNPDAIAQQKGLEIIKKVQKLVVVPTQEMPNVSIITDKRALGSQIFFQNAENGDVLLVYPKALEAVLYRPSTDKIVAVTSLVNDVPQNTATNQTSSTSKVAPVSTTTQSTATTSKSIKK